MNSLTFIYCIVFAVVLTTALTFGQQSRETRRIPENFLKLKEMTTTADSHSEGDDVFAIPIDDFRALDYWYGRRLKKRSLLSIEEPNKQKKEGYSSWGGKRKFTDIYQLPKGFNPNGGKRFGYPRLQQYNQNEGEREGKKRTSKTFANWAGKRSKNSKPFIIWGGKRSANSFKTWGGKRSPFDDSYSLIPDTQLTGY